MNAIYKITNKINNKVYIGQTTLSIEQRWKYHVQDCLSGKVNVEKRPLYEAMLKYGLENFSIELIEEVQDICELDAREIYYIKQYNSYIGFENSNGYNATLGGKSKRKIDWTIERIEWLISEYNKGKNCVQLSKELGCSSETISTKLKSLGFEIICRPSNKRSICKLDLEGNLIDIYDSIKSAAESINKKPNDIHISEVCKGKRKTGGGYKWMYYEDYISQIEE